MTSMTTDFCVVGGGPAGLSLALLLARSGADVVVIERARSFDREYRGEILQPGALELLDQLGVLPEIRRRGGYELERFQLVDHGRVLMDVDYRSLRKPYNFLLSLPQRILIEALHLACSAQENLHLIDGSSVNSLIFDEDRVVGAVHGSGDGARQVYAHCVVAADGRYSKVRRLAGIEYDRIEAFEHDVLWFKIPADERRVHEVRVYRDAGSPVLLHDSYPDRLQVGWTLPHKGYRRIAERGIEHVRGEIAKAVPPYADAIREHITSLTDLTLLDVFSGTARQWARDGLVLIGDAAHTHGPIGAQGLNLAIQDAVTVHPVLMRSLNTRNDGVAVLSEFERQRRPSIQKVHALQSRQGKAMLSAGPVADAIRPVAAKLLSYTPLYRKVLNQIAYGDRPVRVHYELLVA
ncbi:FAD-binding protein [Planosporangium thailandense]|uniref:FAD-binding protein n=1 Tax=Planosporangium thailandense TaxID=765197 RepID=A0ABX0XVL8_9ACTN|nr:FAD-dependent oxidoreductase [Planosporangium thailandense]NJC69937.1 FAD-binding protein [Planosporangium thailandense]